MSGIYVHIPFCRKACHYCNFHFSTQTRLLDDMVKALLLELEIRKTYLPAEPIDSIYFGGGTPSVLKASQLEEILDSISTFFSINQNPEITLEANPDDLTKDYLKSLKSAGINRLSIGVQSFFDEDLIWMNRSHNSEQAISCIDDAQNLGFDDITIDLIFALPQSNMKTWIANLEKFKSFDLPHVSVYGLTVEPKTALRKMIETGRSPAVNDKDYEEQFIATGQFLEASGYERYEISNYARDQRYARHNSSYWQGKPYMGIGPSAHSFDGLTRQWNISNNPRYIKALSSGEVYYETEILSEADRFNEYLLTGLRTKWGCRRDVLEKMEHGLYEEFNESAQKLMSIGLLSLQEGVYRLTDNGLLLSDSVCSELFVGNL